MIEPLLRFLPAAIGIALGVFFVVCVASKFFPENFAVRRSKGLKNE